MNARQIQRRVFELYKKYKNKSLAKMKTATKEEKTTLFNLMMEYHKIVENSKNKNENDEEEYF